jgi:pimeloyl-ACP methyl ester carboxylesterase
MRSVFIKPASVLTVALSLAAASPAAAQRQDRVTFAEPTPLADLAEIVRRTRPPVYGARIAARGQPVDVSKEHYLVYVPPRRPSQGYALLVFVPPWSKARVPADWASVLDEKGVIFASANESGNDTEVRSRRMPLALIAAANLMKKYGVDPSRVFVGGFSGGARVAMRLALAYPDLFRGALLNSGSDPIGTRDIPIPPADLFHTFQERSRLFYIAGDGDQMIVNWKNASMHSMRDWCVFHIAQAVMPHRGHDVATPSALEKGLTALLEAPPPGGDDLASCRSQLQTKRDAEMGAIERLIATDDRPAARKALDDLDAEFGGLAAPESLALDAKIR